MNRLGEILALALLCSAIRPPPSSAQSATPVATAAAMAPVIDASPNPVSAGSGLGTTTITWSTGNGGDGAVYVSRDGAPEALFAAGPSGSSVAPWIAGDSVYVFRLYSAGMPRALLATVTVRTSAATIAPSDRPSAAVYPRPSQMLAVGVSLVALFIALPLARRLMKRPPRVPEASVRGQLPSTTTGVLPAAIPATAPTSAAVSTSGAGRIMWIDIFRGLAILLVVVGHARSPYTPLIYSFHMPAFFFISGYAGHLGEGTGVSYLRRKFTSLMLPFFYFNLGLLLVTLGFSAFAPTRAILTAPLGPEKVVPALQQLLVDWSAPTSWAGATWFLPALFIASIAGRLVYAAAAGSAKGFAALSFLVWVGAAYLAAEPVRMPLDADMAFIGLPFLLAGSLFRRTDVFERQIDHRFMVPITLLVLWSAHAAVWIRVFFPEREFSPYYQITLTSLCGVYFLWFVARGCERMPPLARVVARIGRDSMWIMAFHFVGFKVSIIVLYCLGADLGDALTALTPPERPPGLWMIHSTIAVLVSLLLAPAVRRVSVRLSPMTGTA